MIDLNYVAIAVAAVVAFVLSTVYYIVFGEQLRRLSPAAAGMGNPPPWKMLVEIVRSLVLASVLAGLAALIGITDWIGAVQLGLALWIGFPLVLWVGAVMWENVPVRLAALHAGDWLVKVLVLSVIVSVWR